MAPEDAARLMGSVKAIASDCTKRDKKRKRNIDSSKEALIADDKWVELEEVKTELEKVYPRMIGIRDNPIYDKPIHDSYIDFMIIHWFYNAPQGRIGAFEHLTKADADNLCEHSEYYMISIYACIIYVSYNAIGFISSTHFKTASKHGVQPITIAKSTVLILQLYMDLVQKHIKQQCWRPEDPLFLTRDGNAMTSCELSHCYSRFMYRHLDKNVNTTGYRSLVQTSAEEALDAGTITAAERAAFHTINGHSSATCKQYYLHKSSVKAANTAMKAFCKLVGNEAEDDITDVHVSKKSELGCKHCDPATVKKATWTPEELFEVLYDLVLIV